MRLAVAYPMEAIALLLSMTERVNVIPSQEILTSLRSSE